MKKQTGFTLIELIVVIAILGILAATALPKFIDLSGDAQKAKMQGFAGAITSGSNINYSAYLARRTVTDGSAATNGVTDTKGGCTESVANSLLQQAMSGMGTLTFGGPTSLSMGAIATCTFSNGSHTVSYTITGAH